MKKWFFNFMAGLSLLLCLATAGLWVRSYWKWGDVRYVWLANSDLISCGVFSNHGSAGVSCFHYGAILDSTPNRGFTIVCGQSHAEDNAVAWSAFGGWYYVGFGYANAITTPRASHKLVAVCFPHWLLLWLFAILPLKRFVRYRRQRNRLRMGLCLNCGYDLRATLDRCPECGTPVPTGMMK